MAILLQEVKTAQLRQLFRRRGADQWRRGASTSAGARVPALGRELLAHFWRWGAKFGAGAPKLREPNDEEQITKFCTKWYC